LGVSQALWILGAPVPSRVGLARAAAVEGLSLRELRRRVARLRPAKRPAADANTRAAAEQMRAAIGSKVEIARRLVGGSVRISSGYAADSNGIYDSTVAGR